MIERRRGSHYRRARDTFGGHRDSREGERSQEEGTHGGPNLSRRRGDALRHPEMPCRKLERDVDARQRRHAQRGHAVRAVHADLLPFEARHNSRRPVFQTSCSVIEACSSPSCLPHARQAVLVHRGELDRHRRSGWVSRVARDGRGHAPDSPAGGVSGSSTRTSIASRHRSRRPRQRLPPHEPAGMSVAPTGRGRRVRPLNAAGDGAARGGERAGPMNSGGTAKMEPNPRVCPSGRLYYVESRSGSEDL